jgi:predicted HTH transcriptional regulator
MFDFDINPFNHAENSTLEFKQNYTNKSLTKYTQTICAFLNTEGGNIIFGINDSNNPIGLDLCDKELDIALTSLDNIIHNSRIMIMNITTNVKYKLNPNSIKGHIITNKKNKKFIVVTVIKDNVYNDEDYKYVHNGYIYYRLNASNYFEKIEKIYTETELNYMLQRNNAQHNENNKNILTEYNKLLVMNREYKNTIHQMEKKTKNDILCNFFGWFCGFTIK